MFRVGTGWDAHAFGGPGPLRLGGVTIEHNKGLEGHSDADVLVHAICDALLGAAGLPDIGTLFPASDDTYKNINSLKLLKRVLVHVDENEFGIVNIDSVIVAQEPRLAPYIEEMRRTLAVVLRTDSTNIGIKAKSPEGLGAEGEGKGISAQAVALLRHARAETI